jgi:hypothetical protein
VRALRASRIVVDAEALRLRLHARRLALQVFLAAVASVFLATALGLTHLAAWFWLRESCGWMVQSTAALLAAVDLVIGGVLGAVALCLGPGTAETEARLVRQQAWRALVETISWPVIVLRLLRLLRRP